MTGNDLLLALLGVLTLTGVAIVIINKATETPYES